MSCEHEDWVYIPPTNLFSSQTSFPSCQELQHLHTFSRCSSQCRKCYPALFILSSRFRPRITRNTGSEAEISAPGLTKVTASSNQSPAFEVFGSWRYTDATWATVRIVFEYEPLKKWNHSVHNERRGQNSNTHPGLYWHFCVHSSFILVCIFFLFEFFFLFPSFKKTYEQIIQNIEVYWSYS